MILQFLHKDQFGCWKIVHVCFSNTVLLVSTWNQTWFAGGLQQDLIKPDPVLKVTGEQRAFWNSVVLSNSELAWQQKQASWSSPCRKFVHGRVWHFSENSVLERTRLYCAVGQASVVSHPNNSFFSFFVLPQLLFQHIVDGLTNGNLRLPVFMLL